MSPKEKITRELKAPLADDDLRLQSVGDLLFRFLNDGTHRAQTDIDDHHQVQQRDGNVQGLRFEAGRGREVRLEVGPGLAVLVADTEAADRKLTRELEILRRRCHGVILGTAGVEQDPAGWPANDPIFIQV